MTAMNIILKKVSIVAKIRNRYNQVKDTISNNIASFELNSDELDNALEVKFP